MTRNIYVTIEIDGEIGAIELTVLTGQNVEKLFSRIDLAIAREFDPNADAIHLLMQDEITDRKESTPCHT